MINLDIKYAQIIVNNRATQVDKPFTYILDGELKDLVKEGMRVVIPFGKGNKMIKGIVIGIQDEFNGGYSLKKVVDVLDDKPLISKELIDLSIWMKDNYLSPYLDAFQPVLPPGDFKEVNTFIELIKGKSIGIMDENELRIISYLNTNGKILLGDMKKDLNISKINLVLNSLEKNGVIETSIDIKTTVEKRLDKWVKLIDRKLLLSDMLEIVGKRAIKQVEIIE